MILSKVIALEFENVPDFLFSHWVKGYLAFEYLQNLLLSYFLGVSCAGK